VYTRAVVYTFTKLHDGRIAIVGVGVCVGAVECQLYAATFLERSENCVRLMIRDMTVIAS